MASKKKTPDLAIAILGSGPRKGGDRSEDTEMDMAAAENLMDAIQSGDPARLLEAWAGMPCPATMGAGEEEYGG